MRVLQAVSTLLTWGYAFVFFTVLGDFLPMRRSRLVRAAAYLACIFLADCIVYAHDLPSLLGPMAGLLAYLLAFHRGRLPEKLTALLVFYPALTAVNYLMMDMGSRLFFALAPAARREPPDDPRLLLAGTALYAFSKLLRLLFWLAVHRLLRGSLRRIAAGLPGRAWAIVDVLMLASFVAVFTILYFLPEGAAVAYPICGAALCSSFGCIFLAGYLCEAWQNARRLEQLEAQRDYYKGLVREEERVRGLYHDMKNHLLVLQAGADAPQAARSLQTLQRRLEEYETYRPTGNDYLDVLLREKARAARERAIDFQADADAAGTDFLDPLDLSAIFGNALDNAIEACEKLPPGRRLITVRVGRVRELLLILVENTAQAGASAGERTTKADPFLHGFGLPNIRRAAEKYGGQCSVRAENGLFTLKVLLPLP